jgi:hypothetical protein
MERQPRGIQLPAGGCAQPIEDAAHEAEHAVIRLPFGFGSLIQAGVRSPLDVGLACIPRVREVHFRTTKREKGRNA